MEEPVISAVGMEADGVDPEGHAPRSPELLGHEHESGTLDGIQPGAIADASESAADERLQRRFVKRVKRRHPDVRVNPFAPEDL